MSHEGWSNEETWLVNLHIENDEACYSYWKEQIEIYRRRITATEEVCEGKLTAFKSARYDLACHMSEELGDERYNRSSLHDDLLNTALRRVNWREIAEHWLLNKRDE